MGGVWRHFGGKRIDVNGLEEFTRCLFTTCTPNIKPVEK